MSNLGGTGPVLPSSSRREAMLNATVAISFNDDASCDSVPFSVVKSLGTITDLGIWTHDHIAGAGQFWGQLQEMP